MGKRPPRLAAIAANRQNTRIPALVLRFVKFLTSADTGLIILETEAGVKGLSLFQEEFDHGHGRIGLLDG